MAIRQALVWPPIYDPKNRRVKGFYPETVTLRKGNFGKLLEHLAAASYYPQATRISIRVILERELLDIFAAENYHIEASFPIRAFPNCEVAYVSFNKPERIGRKSDVEIAKLIDRHRKIETRILEKLASKYCIFYINSFTDATAQEILEFFSSRFLDYPIDLTLEKIKCMPNDHIVYIAKDHFGKLVATFMVDIASVEIEDKPLTFLDFVNVVSEKDGLILIPLMAQDVARRANNYPNPIIYAEARSDVAALQVCCIRAGMQYAGTLSASSLFWDNGENRAEFRDTQVWHVP